MMTIFAVTLVAWLGISLSLAELPLVGSPASQTALKKCQDFYLDNCHKAGITNSKEYKRLCGKLNPQLVKAGAESDKHDVVVCVLNTRPPFLDTNVTAQAPGSDMEKSSAVIFLENYTIDVQKLRLVNNGRKGFYGSLKGTNLVGQESVFRVFIPREASSSKGCVKIVDRQEKEKSLTLKFEEIC